MSSSVLYERLEDLIDVGLLDHDETGACLLTDLGAKQTARDDSATWRMFPPQIPAS